LEATLAAIDSWQSGSSIVRVESGSVVSGAAALVLLDSLGLFVNPFGADADGHSLALLGWHR